MFVSWFKIIRGEEMEGIGGVCNLCGTREKSGHDGGQTGVGCPIQEPSLFNFE